MPYETLDGQLIADLHQALRRYRADDLGETTLARSLSLVQARLQAGAKSDTLFHRSAALREILLECLNALREQNKADASRLLMERFVKGETAKKVAYEFGLPDSTFYNKQSEAVSMLAAILWQMEQTEVERANTQAQLALRKLPASTYTRLFGVADVLNRLAGALADADGRWLITLDGLGGVGKTALAREATKQTLIAGRFNDLVWETAQRERFAWSSRQPIARPALTFEMLLDAIAVQLNHADIRRQPLDRKKADIRFLLCEAPYLIVLDNLETADDVQPMVDELWPLTNPSKVLLTSRERLTRYEQNHSIHVTALDANAAIALMRYHGAERGIDQILQATDETLLPIQDVTAGNPLAIKLVVGLVERRPLANVLAALQKATGEAREFYTFIYRYSWDKLSKAGQALLLNMPHLPPGGGDWDDLLAVSGLPEPDLSPAVDELIGLSLLNVGGPDEHRYSIHPLTRHFILSELVQS
ncbi:MAG TPA: NB-ARC domain-containing protein [Anaerolineae bacterium]